MKNVVLALLIVCAGCGGSGGSSSGTQSPPQQPTPIPPAPAPPAEPLEPAGVWAGSMRYNDRDHQTLCRIAHPGTSRSQLTCFLMVGPDVIGAWVGINGTISVDAFRALGNFYGEGSPGHSFQIIGGSITSTTLTLDFHLNHVTYTFVGVPARQPTTETAYSGVYTSAHLRGPISFSVEPTTGVAFGQGGSCTVNVEFVGLDYSGLLLEGQLAGCGSVPNAAYRGYGIVTESVLVPHNGESTMLVFALFSVASFAQWIGGSAIK